MNQYHIVAIAAEGPGCGKSYTASALSREIERRLGVAVQGSFALPIKRAIHGTVLSLGEPLDEFLEDKDACRPSLFGGPSLRDLYIAHARHMKSLFGPDVFTRSLIRDVSRHFDCVEEDYGFPRPRYNFVYVIDDLRYHGEVRALREFAEKNRCAFTVLWLQGRSSKTQATDTSLHALCLRPDEWMPFDNSGSEEAFDAAIKELTDTLGFVSRKV